METHTDNNGFTVSQEYDSIKEFLSMDMDMLNECIHIVANKENHKITFYRLTDQRLTNECNDNVRISFTLDNCNILFRNTENIPKNLCLHNTNAKTVLTFLECLKNEHSSYQLTFEYYRKNNSKMLEKGNLNNESIFMRYKTETNRYNEIEVSGIYSHSSTKFANY